MSPTPEIDPAELDVVLDQLKMSLRGLSSEVFTPLGLTLGLDAMVDDIARRAGYELQYDPVGAATDDVFDAMSHADIYGRVSEFNPDTLSQMANNWRSLGETASDDAGEFAKLMAQVVGQDWQGAAAEAAGNGVKQYSDAAVQLMIASHTFADSVAIAHSGLADTKSNVPPPEPISKTDRVLDVFASVSNFVVPGSMKTAQFERDEAEEQARTVMKTLYQPAIRDASDRIPVLPQAFDPLNASTGGGAGGFSGSPASYGSSAAATSVPSSGGGSGVESSGQARSTDMSSVPNSASQPATPQDTSTQAANWASPDPGSGSSPSGPTTAGGNTAGSQGTGTGAGAVGGTPAGGPRSSGAAESGNRLGGNASGGNTFGGTGRSGVGGGLGSSGTGGGGMPRGGSGLGGSGLGSSGPGGSGSGGSGLGGSNAGGGASSGAGGVAGSAAAQGRAGAPGMGAMAPGAGRGGPGEDDVHKTPGYLVDAINGDELIGTLPLVAPPVLGE